MRYDYLVVGAGLFGSVFAYEATKQGKTCLVIDKRNHIGGNIYTTNQNGVHIHQYGAHIFHTNSKEIWDYINQFGSFNNFINSPLARYKDEQYNLPFNMNTFHQIWGVYTPQEAEQKLTEQRSEYTNIEPSNLEEQALKLVGTDIYHKLIKGYTEKQWGRATTELPPFIIKRLPLRMTYDNNYFKDRYQGIPEDGYTAIIEKMLSLTDVQLNTDFFEHRDVLEQRCEKIIYTGMVDEYFGYCYGALDYRSLQFEHKTIDSNNFQGNAVINYTDSDVPYTRTIEHQHFQFITKNPTIVTYEYPKDFKPGDIPYYPINNKMNNDRYQQYQILAKAQPKTLFGGRLGWYRYFDMDDIIREALQFVENELHTSKEID